jgi:hypothetical protein
MLRAAAGAAALPLALWFSAAPAWGQATTTSAVPIYLPGYRPSQWSALRGSVIGSVGCPAPAFCGRD